MATERKKAAVDTDFLLHLVSTKGLREPICDIVAELFDEMTVNPIMHELVHRYELHQRDGTPSSSDAEKALELFDRRIVARTPVEEILGADPAAADYYKLVFCELYQDIRRKTPPVADVLNGWAYRESLGEVHSAVMCIFIDCGLFLSDDGDSKTLENAIRTKFNFDVTVYDRKAACDRAVALSGGSGRLNRVTRAHLAHKRTD